MAHATTCRVLALVGEGRLDPGRAGGDEVYRLTRRAVPWASLLGPGQTVGVEARVHGCTDLPSALLARARVRDAVCDSVSDARCGLPLITQTVPGSRLLHGRCCYAQLPMTRSLWCHMP